MARRTPPPLEQVLGSAGTIDTSRIEGDGPDGRLPLTAEMLRNEPSGNIFGLTQNAGMGWRPEALGGPQYVIVSTMGGRALGAGRAHRARVSHRPLGDRTAGTRCRRSAARRRGDPVRRLLQRPLRRADAGHDRHVRQPGVPERRGHRDAAVDPVAANGVRRARHRDVRQGTAGDDAGACRHEGAARRDRAWRRDAAGTRRRGRRPGPEPRRPLRARSDQPRLRRHHGLPCVRIVRRRVPVPRARPPRRRWSRKRLGLALPHSALAPSGEPVWLELASRSAAALQRLHLLGVSVGQILTAAAIENAMLVHAAFGGSTNLLLHMPAIAAAAGLKPPAVEDWIRINRATPRLVDALPNGPRGFATAQVFMAGGVPEVMLHLRRMGLLNGRVLTATGDTLDATLDWWESSERRRAARARLASAAANRSGPGHHGARRGTPRRADQHGGVSARQPRAAGLGHQGHRDRCRR